MPSRASSETNSRADSAASRSASRSNPASTAAVVNAFDTARPWGDPRPMSATRDASAASTSSAAIVIRPMSAATVGVELFAGQVVTRRGPRRQLRQEGQRDDRRCDPDPGLGQREGALRTGNRDVARGDQTHATGADVAVDGRDHRPRRLNNDAQ